MIRHSCGLLAALFLASAASAQTMPLHQFVERGNKLEGLGPLALLHQGEIKELQTELTAAVNKLREERLRAQKAGKKPTYCPPAGSNLKLNPQQLLKELRVISAGQPKSATTTDGMRVYLRKHYPCP